MGFFDSLGKIAGVASPILGTIGAGLGIINSLKSGHTAATNQNAAIQQQNQFLQYGKNYLDQMQPVQQEASGLAQAPAYQSVQYLNPYNQAMTDLAFQPQADDIARNSQSAVDALRNDEARRGIRTSTGFSNGAAMIRRGQQQDTNAIRANLRYQGGIARYNDAKAAEDARFTRLSSMLAPMAGMINSGGNNAGSLVQTYGNQQSQAGQSLAGGFGALGSSLGAMAGNNRTSTNQVATPAGNTTPGQKLGPVSMPGAPAIPGVTPVPGAAPDPYNRPTLSGTGVYR